MRSAATYLAPAVVDDAAWELDGTGDDLSGFGGETLGTVVGGRFRFVGRAAFLAFRYSPQALQMVAP